MICRCTALIRTSTLRTVYLQTTIALQIIQLIRSPYFFFPFPVVSTEMHAVIGGFFTDDSVRYTVKHFSVFVLILFLIKYFYVYFSFILYFLL